MKTSLREANTQWDGFTDSNYTFIETVNDDLKNIYQVEHTRKWSFENFLANLIVSLIAYHFSPKRPFVNIYIIDDDYINKAT